MQDLEFTGVTNNTIVDSLEHNKFTQIADFGSELTHAPSRWATVIIFNDG